MSTPTANITNREKIYPEEDFKYTGTVNGKQWTANETLGHHSSIYIHSDTDLTPAEETSVRKAIINY